MFHALFLGWALPYWLLALKNAAVHEATGKSELGKVVWGPGEKKA